MQLSFEHTYGYESRSVRMGPNPKRALILLTERALGMVPFYTPLALYYVAVAPQSSLFGNCCSAYKTRALQKEWTMRRMLDSYRLLATNIKTPPPTKTIARILSKRLGLAPRFQGKALSHYRLLARTVDASPTVLYYDHALYIEPVPLLL